MNRTTILSFLIILCLFITPLSAIQVSQLPNTVLVIEIKDAITTATAEMVEEAVRAGGDANTEAVIIILDTPGGQLDATMRIVESIERSTIPVISFVHPEGAKAWSAGTLILIASHIAAMAPHTVIGSVQPVSYTPLGGGEPVTDEKVLNALSLFMVERARMHGRNETAARLFVEENLNLNSMDALMFNVIEVIASDLDMLLDAVNGYPVNIRKGETILRTEEVSLLDYTPSLRIRILAAISNPMLAYLLFIVGLYALIFGLSSPGYGGEVIGGIALLTGLIGLGFDINLGALLIIGLGAVLMIGEAYTAGFGILGGGGLFCLIIGGVLLIPFTPSRWMITPDWYSYFMSIALGVAAIIGGFTLLMVYKILKARMRKPVIGGLIGVEVEVVDDITFGRTGFVRYRGEYWKARSEETVKAGDKAVVVDKEGPLLKVMPVREERR